MGIEEHVELYEGAKDDGEGTVMDILEKIKNHSTLEKAEIEPLVMGYVRGKVSKEEMTAFLRAVCEYGLDDISAGALTDVMLHSGEVLSFAKSEYPYADKHSTGGLADTTTLIVAPIVASAGVPFLKMSGRKLGHTGGTLDKLEHFSGLKTEISIECAERIVEEVGACVIAQSKDLVPADKLLYKLRDETATVKSLPLIASSVMSKKLASGADVIVLDVKTGAGAFMDRAEEAAHLANLMVNIGKNAGKKVCAIVSDMNEPLGEYVGGVAEVLDALEVLEGKGGKLCDLSILLASKIISLAKNISFEEAKAQAKKVLCSGEAGAKLMQMISKQGGELTLFTPAEKAKIRDAVVYEVRAKKAGFLCRIDCVKLGFGAREWESENGHGLHIKKRLGNAVNKGDVLCAFLGQNRPQGKTIKEIEKCFEISAEKVEENLLVKRIIE